ncbi:MAG: hypothetical protein CM1200mP2_57190 [Planctomycetaceae bacterium]|nr:MAG: hypothetical protein CM1200mP2_57190 [Planctomycetaceae bacterium]
MRWDLDRFRGQVAYYWVVIDGLIERELVGTDPVSGVDFFQRRNVARANINGVELNGSWELMTNGRPMEISGTRGGTSLIPNP